MAMAPSPGRVFGIAPGPVAGVNLPPIRISFRHPLLGT